MDFLESGIFVVLLTQFYIAGAPWTVEKAFALSRTPIFMVGLEEAMFEQWLKE